MRPGGLGLIRMIALWGLLITLSLASETASSSPVPGGVLNVGVNRDPVGLDPNLVTAAASYWRVQLLYNRLVRYDPDGGIEPDLAERWDTPNPTTYVFHLRRGVKFHNGREFTAEDVKYTLERIVDPKTGSPARSYFTPIEQIVIRDPHTVEVHLKHPLASFLDALAAENASIVPAEEVRKYGNLQRTAVGTGPFMLAEWAPDNYMRLVRNPGYWKPELPYLDEVVFRVVPEEASLLAGLRSGSLDLVAITQGPLIQAAKTDRAIRVIQTPALHVRTFGYNCSRPPFDNVKIRQALSLAIDAQQIVDVAAYGLGLVTGPIPASAKGWAVNPSELPFYRPDLAKARELLEEAGYARGFSMRVLTSPTFEGGLTVAQVIQQQLKQIGVSVELDVVEHGIYIDRWVKRDYEGIVELRLGGADPDRFLYRMLHSAGAVNNFLFRDSEVDRLLEQGRSLLDAEARGKIYVDVQRRIADQAPVRFLYVTIDSRLAARHVHGFRLTPTGSYQYLESTWISK